MKPAIGPAPEQPAKTEDFIDISNNRPLLRYFQEIYRQVVYAGNFGLALDDDDRRGAHGRRVLLSKLFVPPKMAGQRIDPGELARGEAEKDLPDRIDFHQALGQHQRLFVLGDPGSGKSTLINWLNLELSFSGDNRCKSVLGPLVPLNFILRDIHGLGSIKSWDALLSQWLKQPDAPAGLLKGEDEEKILDQLLASGQALLLFDGLDEITASSSRRNICRVIAEAMTRFPRCRFIVTSRILGFSRREFFEIDQPLEPDALPGMEDSVGPIGRAVWQALRRERKTIPPGLPARQYLAPFDRGQVRSFCRNWYDQYVGPGPGVSERVNDLVDRLGQNRGLAHLSHIPVLLNIICFIHARKGRLPHGRVELYRRIAETYLVSLDQARGLKFQNREIPLDFNDLYRLLAEVAWQIQQQRSDDSASSEQGSVLIAGKDVEEIFKDGLKELGFEEEEALRETAFILQFIAHRSGLFIPRGRDGQGAELYAFTHLSFMEFFVAVKLQFEVEFWEPCGSEWQELAKQLQRPAWKEPFILFFELLDDGRRVEHYLQRLLAVQITDTTRFAELNPGAIALPTKQDLDCWLKKQKKSVADSINCPGLHSWQALAAIVMDSSIKFPPALRKNCIALFWSLALYPDFHKDRWGSGSALAPILGRLWTARFDSLAIFQQQAGGMTRLNLWDAPISDLRPLSGLKNLEWLSLTNTAVADLAPLAGLTNLEWLSLTNTSVSDLAPLSGLTNLEWLFLIDTSVADLAPLAGLTNLEWLFLFDTSVADLAPLSGLRNLEGLSLDNTSVADLAPLAGLTNLKNLSLTNTSVADLAPLAGLTNLKEISLDNTSVSDLAPLAELTNLKELSLAGTKVGDIDPSMFAREVKIITCYKKGVRPS